MGDATDTASIGEDYVECEMSQSSTDGAFWSASVVEGYYICANGSGTDKCDEDSGGLKLADAADTNYTKQTEGTSDWVTPFSDDDPDDFWCTKANTTIGATLSPYECTKLKCVIERLFDTGDDTSDLAFTVSAGTTDTLEIKPGRARLFINSSDAQFDEPVTNRMYTSAQSLEISASAISNIVTASAALAGFAALIAN